MVKSLRVGAHKYRVKRKNLGTLAGLCNVSKRIIYIDPDSKGQRGTEALLHEALHAVVNEYGITYGLSENEEEFLVRVLESGLLQLFLGNKKFTKDILKKLG